MPGSPPRPLTRERLLVCIAINQLATPGLGSLMARRVVSGTGQLFLALAGFGLIVVWMSLFFYGSIMRQLGESVAMSPRDWMWNWGRICFGASWVWSLVTSVSLWIQAGKLPRTGSDVPPKISDVHRR